MAKIVKAGGALGPGELRELGTGDKIILLREAVSGESWAVLWDAIGVAVQRGAELRVTNLKVVY